MEDRRFIEESFPVKEVSKESAREKNIRHGHISTLHIWWARRPLASSRATAYAALIPPPKSIDEWQQKKEFIVELSKWENSNNPKYIERAREEILKANNGEVPKVLDPFSGGGAIPLEALRLGCETYAGDLNPVAVLIEKCTLEYPQKYGRPVSKKDFLSKRPWLKKEENSNKEFGFDNEDALNPLLEDVKYWGEWVLNEAKKEIGRFYPEEPDLPAPRQDTYWVYVLKCSDNSFYIGQTNDIRKRFEDHTIGKVSWTKSRLPVSLIYYESFQNREDAVRREKELKTGFGRKWLKRKYKSGGLMARQAGGSVPVGYIWARTIPCQNPTCGAEIPLMRQFWLAKKKNKKVSLYPFVVNDNNNPIQFKIVGDGYEPMPEGFDPSHGTVSKAIATCPVCGSVIEANTTRRLFKEGKAGERMIAVVTHKEGTTGKHYRIATERDMEIFRDAEEYLTEKREKLMDEWGIDPVPDEPTPEGKGRGAERAFSVRNYALDTWGDLFNSRQKLALITFTEKVRQAHKRMLEMGYDPDYARAVVSYLGLGLNRIADKDSVLCRLIFQTEAIGYTYTRQALPMLWDYFEMDPIKNVSGWNTILREILENIKYIVFNKQNSIIVKQASAADLPYKDNYFDAVLTDPPYYDNVPYSYLSDFFYVWLKRSLGDLYPDLFSTPLTPKKNEIVAYSNGPGGWHDGKAFFENMLKKSFQEIYRVLKPNGVAVIVYAHKSTAGWETLINSLLDSGLIVTGAWPINTEMAARLQANETAALASSIYIVARKMEREATGFYNQVREELENYLNKKLERLWEEGISGSDFFIAAIGSAIVVFGKYQKVMDYAGNVVRAEGLLKDVRRIVTDYAVKKILHNGFAGEITDLTRFYVLYRWEFGAAKAPFDEARKLAQSCSIDLANEWNRHGFIKKEKEFIKVLGPQERNEKELKNASELIDVLHRVLLLWEKSKQDEIIELLQESGFGESEAFYRVAQAISETLPNELKEKKLLDGFLSGKERLREAIKDTQIKQGELFE